VLEVVLTQPITELEVVIGKFLGCVLFLWIALALTAPIPLALAMGSDFRWGPAVAQYVGAALLATGMTGVGVWASSLARSQITAFIIGVAVMFLLVLVGLDPLLVGLPPALGAIAARLGVLSHFESTGRGVIDLRDVVYFVSLAGVFVLFAYGSILAHKLSRTGAAMRRLRTGVTLAAVIVLVVNLLGGYIGGRLDLTPGGAYTLSRPTKDIVRSLDDIVTIKMFASDALPTDVALMQRELGDVLRDLRSASRGKVRVVHRNPDKDESAASDARNLGIQPVQFNVIGSSELQVKEGFFGLSVQYGSGSEVIPFINRTDDLEFRLVSAIRNLTRPKKPVVGVLAYGQQQQGVNALRSELSRTYEVREISLSDSTQPAADVAALLVIGSPDSVPPGSMDRMRTWFRNGGGALMLLEGSEIPPPNPQMPQMMFAMPRPVTWNELLSEFGVDVKSDVVYDLAANEVIPAQGQGPFQVLQRYPFFVRAGSSGASTVNKDISNLLLPWPSSIDTTASESWVHTPLFATTEAAGISSGPTMIDPSRDFPRTDLARRLLAVQVAPQADTGSQGRVIVVGSAQFAADNFAQHALENLAFSLNAIDWLAQEPALIAIRSREMRPPPLRFTSAGTQDFVKYANVIGVPVLVALGGFVRLTRRRQRTREPYHPVAEVAS
jgi:ABC-type uncharacterized transport system involved in gliding motility auxiliary subunit